RSSFYFGARGALLVYDVTRRETLRNIVPWMEEFVRNCQRKKVAAVLVGNKIDLRPEVDDAISTEEGEEACEELRARFGIPVVFVETSAKTGENVDKAFRALAVELLRGSGVSGV
ncbi:hypothetical protein DRO32_04280, partial [Candidatus Bathyarchaeota archaeon]